MQIYRKVMAICARVRRFFNDGNGDRTVACFSVTSMVATVPPVVTTIKTTRTKEVTNDDQQD